MSLEISCGGVRLASWELGLGQSPYFSGDEELERSSHAVEASWVHGRDDGINLCIANQLYCEVQKHWRALQSHS